MFKVKESKHGRGRGIFAVQFIKKGALIHKAPVIVSPKAEFDYLKQTILRNYLFDWGESPGDSAIALGYGSLFNHSYRPNAIYSMNIKKRTIKFYAIKDIPPGEEIVVNYNGRPNDKSPLWFEVK
ncbi:SET domain-containing protein [Peribacillus deserti]|uniref:SET domain-containing protein-lysine N-methyltransferase n=1 Tax=Peribacillus deserti TaxID=673318 RepID=A0A2N5M4Y4_9BACI|nr:SET domain-containing protein [Peribacillus deserti]PLT29424.1 SET domain-containing protein-lysine N-methyltransferase [Peribacillus deserti]